MIQFYLAVVVLLACLYFKWKLSFWARKKVEGPAPLPFFGNMFDVLKGTKHFGEVHDDIYKSYPTANYVGFYKMEQPVLLIRDLDLVKNILTTNFQSFGNNEFHADAKLDPLISKNPFSTPLETWKPARSLLSPLFTSTKVKNVFPIISDISNNLLEYIDNELSASSRNALEVKSLFSKYTINVVATAAFGVDGECFTNTDSSFFKMVTGLFVPSLMTKVRDFIFLIFPIINYVIQMPFVPKHVDRWLRDIIRQVIDQREKSKVKPNDFLQGILDMREKESLQEDDIVGNSLTLLSEGYETSSTLMAFCIYELAINPDVQRQVQKEIQGVMSESNNSLKIENLHKLEYLERALYETMRAHSSVFALNKTCTKEYELPPQFPDSRTNGIKIEPGYTAIIPVHSIHMDPSIYPNPHKFDPDRFTEENKNQRHKYSFLAFGEGPRMCLGMKFGLAQSKFALACILSKYNVKLSSKTEQPLRFAKRSFLLTAQNGIWIDFIKK